MTTLSKKFLDEHGLLTLWNAIDTNFISSSDIEKLISGLKKDLCDLKFTYQRNTI